MRCSKIILTRNNTQISRIARTIHKPRAERVKRDHRQISRVPIRLVHNVAEHQLRRSRARQVCRVPTVGERQRWRSALDMHKLAQMRADIQDTVRLIRPINRAEPSDHSTRRVNSQPRIQLVAGLNKIILKLVTRSIQQRRVVLNKRQHLQGLTIDELRHILRCRDHILKRPSLPTRPSNISRLLAIVQRQMRQDMLTQLRLQLERHSLRERHINADRISKGISPLHTRNFLNPRRIRVNRLYKNR